MARFKAERAKQKEDPLVIHGRKVHLAYSNERAFETREFTRTYGQNNEHSFSYTKSRLPSPALLAWMEQQCGPRGALWTTKKVDDGIDIYFAVPGQAMMFKLAWGGL